jgi:hypothetical protein
VLFGCDDECRDPLLWAGEAFGMSRGFFPDRTFFFLDDFTLLEESVAVPPGLRFLGGEEGGVVKRVPFWVRGVVFRFGLRRLSRGPFGVMGAGD